MEQGICRCRRDSAAGASMSGLNAKWLDCSAPLCLTNSFCGSPSKYSEILNLQSGCQFLQWSDIVSLHMSQWFLSHTNYNAHFESSTSPQEVNNSFCASVFVLCPFWSSVKFYFLGRKWGIWIFNETVVFRFCDSMKIVFHWPVSIVQLMYICKVFCFKCNLPIT